MKKAQVDWWIIIGAVIAFGFLFWWGLFGGKVVEKTGTAVSSAFLQAQIESCKGTSARIDPKILRRYESQDVRDLGYKMDTGDEIFSNTCDICPYGDSSKDRDFDLIPDLCDEESDPAKGGQKITKCDSKKGLVMHKKLDQCLCEEGTTWKIQTSGNYACS